MRQLSDMKCEQIKWRTDRNAFRFGANLEILQNQLAETEFGIFFYFNSFETIL